MSPLFLAIIVAVLVYLLVVALVPRHMLGGSSAYTRNALARLHEQHQSERLNPAELISVDAPTNPLAKAFLLLPFASYAVPQVQRAGMWDMLDRFMLALMLIFLFLVFVLAKMGLVAVLLALGITWGMGWMYLRNREQAIRRTFLTQFPEALDMIVRSVKTGYPLPAALAMVAENMPAPLGTEFKRVVSETNFGWPLFEALARLAERIDEPDVRFFTVVLSVQQESGGNLSEVLSNLSSVLKNRKQLRLKIRALSSEGRATAWILGLLPVFMLSAVHYSSPEHLTPLFATSAGHMVLAIVGSMMAFGILIVRKLVNMDI